MKTIKLTLLGAILISFISNSNAQMTVKEEMNKFDGEMVNSLTIDIPDVEEKDISKEFKSLLKDYKGEVKKDKSSNTFISDISNDPITVYFEVKEIKGGGVTLITAWKLSGGFINSESTKAQYASASKLVREFAIKAAKNAVAEKLEKAQKEQEKLEKEQEKLKKEKEKLDKSIAENKEKIIKAEGEIKEAENNLVTNEEEQKKKQAEIEKQKKVLEEIQKKLGSIK